MALPRRKTERGLPSIARAREDRSLGRTRWTTQAGLVAGAVVIAGLIAHKVVSGRELESDRQALLAKQRAVAVTLGPEWFRLRDGLEADVLAAAIRYRRLPPVMGAKNLSPIGGDRSFSKDEGQGAGTGE